MSQSGSEPFAPTLLLRAATGEFSGEPVTIALTDKQSAVSSYTASGLPLSKEVEERLDGKTTSYYRSILRNSGLSLDPPPSDRKDLVEERNLVKLQAWQMAEAAVPEEYTEAVIAKIEGQRPPGLENVVPAPGKEGAMSAVKELVESGMAKGLTREEAEKMAHRAYWARYLAQPEEVWKKLAAGDYNWHE
jgi:hypothetical protein